MLEKDEQPLAKIAVQNRLFAIPFLKNPDTPTWCSVPA
jgi:hypothetical protein